LWKRLNKSKLILSKLSLLTPGHYPLGAEVKLHDLHISIIFSGFLKKLSTINVGIILF